MRVYPSLPALILGIDLIIYRFSQVAYVINALGFTMLLFVRGTSISRAFRKVSTHCCCRTQSLLPNPCSTALHSFQDKEPRHPENLVCKTCCLYRSTRLTRLGFGTSAPLRSEKFRRSKCHVHALSCHDSTTRSVRWRCRCFFLGLLTCL